MVNKFFFIKIFLNLGFKNVALVAFYRIVIKSFLGKLFFKNDLQYKNKYAYFNPSQNTPINIEQNENVIRLANKILEGKFYFYGYKLFDVGLPPNWFFDPFSNSEIKNFRKHWTELGDFDSSIKDIKNIWELSRFNWMLTLALAFKFTSKRKYVDQLNFLLNDWVHKNPLNTGPNWICGQESSIRVINLILVNDILGLENLSNDLLYLLKIHVDRIAATTFYAKAQDNNHGITEGIALFLGGKIISKNSNLYIYNTLHIKGLKLIENRINRLILGDGTFSQYSMVYHRMVLDMVSVLEIFRKKLFLDSFSRDFYSKVGKAIYWYQSMIDIRSGGAPNLGGNDGTYLFNIDGKEYRDFRPSLLLASAVFKVPIKRQFNSKHILQSVFSLDHLSSELNKIKPEAHMEGGFLKLVRSNGMLWLRCPKYIFRPSNADALHVDIWNNGVNWIRDAGSYSYALSLNEHNIFSGTRGHSTIQFDNRNQMPKVSRFLFAEWLKPKFIEYDIFKSNLSSAYVDFRNNFHQRSVSKINNGWRVDDKVISSSNSIVLRFLLCPGNWVQNDKQFILDKTVIEIRSDKEASYSLKSGKESLFYLLEDKIPVIEIFFSKNNNLSSKITFNN